MIKFYCYSKCGTCQKALKFLKENGFDFEMIDIKTTKFTKEDIKELHIKSKNDIKKLFNTSGNLYKELNLKEKLNRMSLDECYELLTTDGMLIKRPILIKDHHILFGFNEQKYKEVLKSASRG